MESNRIISRLHLETDLLKEETWDVERRGGIIEYVTGQWTVVEVGIRSSTLKYLVNTWKK
jgi:hypothetical protein